MRAMHLEVASNLTSDPIISAFRRFLACRGQVKTVRCDCGTNIVGSRKVLESSYEFLAGNKFSDDGVTEAALDTESDICQEYQDRIQICLSLLPASISNHSNVSIDNARSLLKQPTAPLPRFTSKENEDFTSFLKEFRSTTSSFTYPDRDLLLLLKQQVDGRAKLLLDSLEADKQTFNDAVELLKAAVASESTRKVNTIRQLTELKLGLSDDPYSYISKFRTILQSVSTLEITADDFIQYFAWYENARKITKFKGPAISGNFQGKNQDTSTSLAIKVDSNINNASKSCNLCQKVDSKDINHFMSKCPNFPTAQEKVSKLSEYPKSSEISDIDVLLGSDSSHCLLGKDVFGNNDPSVYIDTLHGIMLTGNLDRLINNVDYLQTRDSNFYCMNTDYSEPLLSFPVVDSSPECDEQTTDLNRKLIDFTLKNLFRETDGRIRVPLLWNSKLSHLLKNERLAKLILKSTLKKHKKDKEHPNYSFIPHMAVFKPQRETTKCRIVYLSNLSENERNKGLNLSHNQCMFPGPNLNQKMLSAFIHLRFDEKLLTFDLKKAFNMLTLSENDQAKLLFYWFRNVRKDDYTLVAFRNVRLSFGLRCSPFLLMISLFYILIINSDKDDDKLKECKRLIYSLTYMDNGAYSCDNLDTLQWAYSVLPKVFESFKFSVQQLITNDISLQSRIDKDMKTETPIENKLFGLIWNRISEEIFTKPINLNADASTKREVLTTIAAQFDIFGFNLPLMNRSRLFMHRLQCCKDLDWDKPLNNDLVREWKNLYRQANSSPIIRVPMFVGPRNGEYKLIAFTDASRSLYGVVVFICHVETNQCCFLQSKNRMVNTHLKNKSIPSLELNAVLFGVESLMELHRDLTGDVCMKPINISELLLYTDSICSLHWLNSCVSKMEKMQRLGVFTTNRLNSIQRLCEKYPVKFCFVSGKENPADSTTRPFSYRSLMKTNFLIGPDSYFIKTEEELYVVIPNPLTVDKMAPVIDHNVYVGINFEHSPNSSGNAHLIDPNDISDFRRLVLIHRRVLRCIMKWKQKIGIEGNPISPNSNLFAQALTQIISTEQKLFFPEVFSYFQDQKVRLKDLPKIVTQLNVFLDNNNVIRVKSKFKTWDGQNEFPILLPRDSALTRLIVLDARSKLSQSGCYAVLSAIRRTFYVPKHFSTIKKILKTCVHCRRFNNRTFQLNQKVYREFRSDPPSIPFNNVFIDYLGPFTVKKDSESQKVWLLIFACTWSRGIDLRICNDLSVKEFLRSFQLHCFNYGVPQLVVSDLGSQLVAGANIIHDFISDHETLLYFEENNVKPLTFQQYFKGCSKLGSLVETCVKMVKRLLFGSIKNWVLSFAEFEFVVEHTKHVVNKRPIAFKNGLREANVNDEPEPITPEKLIRGYDTLSLNLIPSLQGMPHDPDW
ncbi:uncharacterized protein [Palaemon carinicauda]|uniref:uncharacterized protein n=1 Tax=Palaemon carinicauda TaxID=392227 RepID=UPI0035B65813